MTGTGPYAPKSVTVTGLRYHRVDCVHSLTIYKDLSIPASRIRLGSEVYISSLVKCELNYHKEIQTIVPAIGPYPGIKVRTPTLAGLIPDDLFLRERVVQR